MVHRVLAVVLLGVSGCFGPATRPMLVPHEPLSGAPPVPPPVRPAYAPAALDAAARVDSIGREILAANKQIGIQPQFCTIGAPQPEIFHRGTVEVTLTEGLVRKCSDGQLAAVLCLELGKMVAEREAQAGPPMKAPDRLPPLDVPVGNDLAGSRGMPDQTHLAELARFEKERKQRQQAPPAPDPRALARSYLTRTGYPATELEAAAPILQEAAENNTFARQLKAPGMALPTRTWTR